MDFFISHAGRDRAWAEWVAWQLKDAGYTIEFDVWDWGAGDNFISKMSNAMNNADRVLALFSEAYFDPKRYTTEEWTAAMVKDDRDRPRLLPFRIEECQVPRLLSPLITHSLHGLDEAEAAALLLDGARGPKRPDGKPDFPPSKRKPPVQGPHPSLPGTRPRIWNAPTRNADFTGRDAALVALRERLLNGAVQVLHGMSGVGKSQLATEYAHRFQGSYDLVWWIDAEQPDLIGEQFAALAVAAEFVTTYLDHTSAVLAVRKRLREERRWLLIFDNVEDTEALKSWNPEGSGHVLITSRNPRWDEVAVREEVDVFTRVESIALLRSRHSGLDEAEADSLADALGDLPLALAQAGGTLAETGMSTGDYLDLLATRAKELLSENRPPSAKETLAAAIGLSLDRLTAEDPTATQLLELCALMAPIAIPTAWFSGKAVQFDPELSPAVMDALALAKIVRRIGRYGLARVGDGIQLHRVIIAVIRDGLSDDRRQFLRSCAQSTLVAMSPIGVDDPKEWALWAKLSPHVINLDAGSSEYKEFRRLSCDLALYLLRRGDTSSALPFIRKIYESWLVRFGPDDIYTLRAATELAHALYLLGDISQAKSLVDDTLPRWRSLYGDDDPGTLRSMNDLSVLAFSMGEYKLSKALNKDIAERRERILGADHPDTLEAWSRFLSGFPDDDDPAYEDDPEVAVRLLNDVLRRQKLVLDESHPQVLSTYASIVRLEGPAVHGSDYVSLLEDICESYGSVLGAEHSTTLSMLTYFASVLVSYGYPLRAKKILKEVCEIQFRTLGVDHHYSISTSVELAGVYRIIGDDVNARRIALGTMSRINRISGERLPIIVNASGTLDIILNFNVGKKRKKRKK